MDQSSRNQSKMKQAKRWVLDKFRKMRTALSCFTEPKDDAISEFDADALAECDVEDLPDFDADALEEQDVDYFSENDADALAEIDADALAENDADALAEIDADALVENDADALAEIDLDDFSECDADALAEIDADALAETGLKSSKEYINVYYNLPNHWHIVQQVFDFFQEKVGVCSMESRVVNDCTVCATIVFSDPTGARNALALDGTTLLGSKIKIHLFVDGQLVDAKPCVDAPHSNMEPAEEHIIVSNIPYTMPGAQIIELFQDRVGRVRTCGMFSTGQSDIIEGFEHFYFVGRARIAFENPGDARRAWIELGNTQLQGQTLEIQLFIDGLRVDQDQTTLIPTILDDIDEELEFTQESYMDEEIVALLRLPSNEIESELVFILEMQDIREIIDAPQNLSTNEEIDVDDIEFLQESQLEVALPPRRRERPSKMRARERRKEKRDGEKHAQ